MLSTYCAGRRALAVIAAVALGFGATISVAAEGLHSPAPPHTVPTNVSGVYAFTQPPASFDPKSASDRELAEWGYRARPKATEGPAEQARWEQEVKLQRVVPYLERREGIYHQPVSGLTLDAHQPGRNIAATSGNWSGIALVPGSGAQPYSTVRANWIVPTVQQAPGTCSGGWDYSSQWVGIGGFNDSFLLQAGSAANVFCDIGGNVPEYYPWVEWLPAAETVLYANSSHALLPFVPGDYLTVNVTATNWSGGVSKNGTLQFLDVTQGWGVSLTFTAASLGGSEVTGQSAEWIVERTDVNGSFATLPDYVTVPWTFTWTKDLGATFHYPNLPGNSTVYQITMLDDSSLDVSYVDVVGPQALWFYPEGSATQ
jgi:hypothetical protein